MLVAHGQFHSHLSAKGAAGFFCVHARLQFPLQGLAVQQERGPFFSPNLLVLTGTLEATDRSDDAVDKDFSQQPRHIDDPPVAEEFTKVSAHRAWRGRIGGPQIDNEDARLDRKAHAFTTTNCLKCAARGFPWLREPLL